MWLFVDDNMTLVNTDNVESIEVSESSIYINTVDGKTHLYGRCVDGGEALVVLNALRTELNL